MEAVDPRPRVSVLESQGLMRWALENVIDRGGFAVVGSYGDATGLLTGLDEAPVDVAVIDSEALTFAPSILGQLASRHARTRVLVYADASEPEVAERCYREGAAGYLSKRHSDPGDLVRCVGALARGERIYPVEVLEAPFRATPTQPSALGAISPRERDVLACIAAGSNNLTIAGQLRISERTVKAHVSALYRKLGVGNRTHLALTALNLGVRPFAPNGV